MRVKNALGAAVLGRSLSFLVLPGMPSGSHDKNLKEKKKKNPLLALVGVEKEQLSQNTLGPFSITETFTLKEKILQTLAQLRKNSLSPPSPLALYIT